MAAECRLDAKRKLFPLSPTRGVLVSAGFPQPIRRCPYIDPQVQKWSQLLHQAARAQRSGSVLTRPKRRVASPTLASPTLPEPEGRGVDRVPRA